VPSVIYITVGLRLEMQLMRESIGIEPSTGSGTRLGQRRIRSQRTIRAPMCP